MPWECQPSPQPPHNQLETDTAISAASLSPNAANLHMHYSSLGPRVPQNVAAAPVFAVKDLQASSSSIQALSRVVRSAGRLQAETGDRATLGSDEMRLLHKAASLLRDVPFKAVLLAEEPLCPLGATSLRKVAMALGRELKVTCSSPALLKRSSRKPPLPEMPEPFVHGFCLFVAAKFVDSLWLFCSRQG
jgi:hypothetical protein